MFEERTNVNQLLQFINGGGMSEPAKEILKEQCSVTLTLEQVETMLEEVREEKTQWSNPFEQSFKQQLNQSRYRTQGAEGPTPSTTEQQHEVGDRPTRHPQPWELGIPGTTSEELGTFKFPTPEGLEGEESGQIHKRIDPGNSGQGTVFDDVLLQLVDRFYHVMTFWMIRIPFSEIKASEVRLEKAFPSALLPSMGEFDKYIPLGFYVTSLENIINPKEKILEDLFFIRQVETDVMSGFLKQGEYSINEALQNVSTILERIDMINAYYEDLTKINRPEA